MSEWNPSTPGGAEEDSEEEGSEAWSDDAPQQQVLKRCVKNPRAIAKTKTKASREKSAREIPEGPSLTIKPDVQKKNPTKKKSKIPAKTPHRN